MYLLGFILGTVLGSLVKSLADRSIKNRSFWGRSYCPHCKKVLQWYDLLPILSYALLRGRCRYCNKVITLDYLLIEILMGFLVAYLFYQKFSVFSFQFSINFQFIIFIFDLVFQTFFITVLAALFLTDIKKMLIPDRIILPSIVITTIFLISTTVYKIGYLYYYLSQSRIGQLLFPPHSDYLRRHVIITIEPFMYAVVSAVLISSFFWILILITNGKGMGGGDVKLGAFMGLGLGFPNAFVALMLAFLIGAVWATAAIILGKKRFGQHIAFGPFLVSGSIISLFWGKQIIDWYLQLSV